MSSRAAFIDDTIVSTAARYVGNDAVNSVVPPVESGPMAFLRDIHRAACPERRRRALTSIVAAVITLGPALDAGQTGVQSVQYRSPEGVEYRSLPDTDAVKS